MKIFLQPRLLFIIFLSFSFLTTVKTIAQEGNIDLSFGDSGKVFTQIEPSYNNIVRTVVTQADKKILVMSASSDVPSSFYTKIIRYKANGVIDSSFGKDGIILIDSIRGFDLRLTSNGQMLLYGQTISFFYKLLRLNKDGDIDYSFADNGIYSFFVELAYPPSGALVIDANNKILLSVPGLAVLRLTSSGKIDSSFGVNGYTRTNGKLGPDLNYFYQITKSLVIESNNKIIVGGDISEYGGYFQFSVVRYTADGIIDSSFGTNGLIISAFKKDTANEDELNTINKIIIQPGNKILIDGLVSHYSTLKLQSILIRLNDNGLYDSSFGSEGIVILGDSDVQIECILLQDDNKIIASGTDNSIGDFVLKRLSPDGKVDSTFGTNGFTLTSFDGDYATARSLCFQDKKLIAAGNFSIDVITYCAVARYNNEDVLAVSLLDFSAIKKSNSVLLSWKTAYEFYNASFIVETMHYNNWIQLSSIAGKGNSNQTQFYIYEDRNPLQGENYYRLKQVDKDGKFTYSQIAAVNFEDGNIIIAYPNPAVDIINISGLSLMLSNNLEIINSKGTVVKKSTTNEANYSWNIESLSKGIYYLRVTQSDKTSSIKFLKK